MADTKKSNLRVVTEEEKRDYKRKIREHRVKVLQRTLITAMVVLVLVAGTGIYLSMRQYSDYDIRASVERTDTKATAFREFKGNILKYSNDGAYQEQELSLFLNLGYLCDTKYNQNLNQTLR